MPECRLSPYASKPCLLSSITAHCWTALAAPEAQSELHCLAVLVMHQTVFGLLLPVVIATWTARAAPLTHLPTAHQQAAEQPWGRAAAAAAAVGRTWDRANAALMELCCGEGYCGLQLCVAAWLLLGNCWMLNEAAAVRRVAGGLPGCA